VAVQQRAGFAKKCKKILAHLGSARALACPFRRPRRNASTLEPYKKVNGRKKLAMARALSPAREARALLRSGILPRRIIRGLVGIRCGGNYLDFYVSSSRQRGNLDGGTGWGIVFEIRAVCLVYRLKVAEVRQEDRSLHDVIKSQPLGS